MKNDILELTKDLITIPSTQHNKKALKKALEVAEKAVDASLTKEKFESKGIHSMLIHNAKPGTKHFKVLLNAHLDVVQAHSEQFKPYEKDGRLYGRGTYDMKAAAATMVLLMNAIGMKLKHPIGLQIVTDEEYSGENGTAYQIREGIRADFAIAGETASNFNIKYQSKGYIALKLTTKGVSSHAAYPWLGENAIVYMNETIATLHKLYPPVKKAGWHTTVSVSRIETSNQVTNKVPDNCTAYIDIRFIPEDEEKVLKNIRKHIHKDVALETIWKSSPHYTDPKDPYLLKLKAITKDVTGKDPQVVETHGGSDMRFFTQLGIPSVEFGPVGGNQHADNEWIDIASLDEYYQTLKKFLFSIK